MKKWQIYALAVLAVAYVALRASKSLPEVVNPTQEAVAGVCVALSEIEDLNAWQLDGLRRSAMAVLQQEYPEGSFVPPDWMLAELKVLGDEVDQSELRRAYRSIGQRLSPAQNSPDYKFGRKVVEDLRGPPKPVDGKCEDCDGTGKVGDGRVFVDCLACGGDGKIDDSDRKEGVFDSETSTQESAGDQVSRVPVGVITGSSCGSTRSRVAFPALKRFLGR